MKGTGVSLWDSGASTKWGIHRITVRRLRFMVDSKAEADREALHIFRVSKVGHWRTSPEREREGGREIEARKERKKFSSLILKAEMEVALIHLETKLYRPTQRLNRKNSLAVAHFKKSCNFNSNVILVKLNR